MMEKWERAKEEEEKKEEGRGEEGGEVREERGYERKEEIRAKGEGGRDGNSLNKQCRMDDRSQERDMWVDMIYRDCIDGRKENRMVMMW
jgi:hypothetical protein